jgi:hypothetical protein
MVGKAHFDWGQFATNNGFMPRRPLIKCHQQLSGFIVANTAINGFL